MPFLNPTHREGQTMTKTQSSATIEIPVSEFKMFAQYIAEHDLWDELEQQLAMRGCTQLTLSRSFMRNIGISLRQKVSTGLLPQTAVLSICGCWGGGKSGGSDGGTKGGKDAGSGVMQPGTSQNDPVNGGAAGGSDGGTGDAGG
jgi:hypothetical protein